MTTVTRNETTVEIKGALYAVEAIEAGECGQSAVRLVKLVSGESYDLIRTGGNVLECTCPDFVCRHEGKGTCCKHLSYAVANGLLPVVKVAPLAAPDPKPAVAPVTSQDVKRAAYFGLKLPVAPVVKPAVAPVVLDISTTTTMISTPAEVVTVRTTAMRPADVREAREWIRMRESAPVVEANPRDSWGPEADADCWTTEAPTVDVEWSDLMRSGLALRSAEIDREVKARHDRRARRGSYLSTWEELQEAAEVLADRRSSCLEGEAPPPLGRRFKAPTPRPAWVGVNRMTDADVHPHGVC